MSFISTYNYDNNTAITAKTKDNSKHDSLSYRLNYALAALKISQSELARRIGTKPQAIQYICANNVKKSQFTYDIALALEIRYEWLAIGQGPMMPHVDEKRQLAKSQQYRTPLLEKKQLRDFVKNNLDINTLAITDYIITNLEKPNSCIALRIDDKSMEPVFTETSTIIVDLMLTASDGAYVVAYIEKIDDFITRTLTIENGVPLLQPYNSHIYKNVNLSTQDKIIGVVIQTVQTFGNP